MADRIVDAHTHAWTHEEVIAWETGGPPDAEQIVYTADDVRDDMDRLGAERACLVATPIHGTGSPYTRRVVAAHPEEFYGVLWLDYLADDVAERVHEALEIDNVLGFRFYVEEGGEWLTSDALDPFWEALAAHDAPQVQFLLRPELLEDVATLAGEHPGVTFVVDHVGQPVPGEDPADAPPWAAIRDVAAHSNTYVKLTHTSSDAVYPFSDLHPYARVLLEAFGSERLLWGSDFIYHFKEATPWETLHFLDEMSFLSTGDRRDLLHRTFESMLP
ncbi:MAG: amidohydrolase [Halobacteriaceae archaeon]